MATVDPLARLRADLASARAAGRDFDYAWEAGTASFARAEHRQWADALEATRHAWQAAWERQPPRVRLEEARALIEEADAERPAAPRAGRAAVLG